MLKSISDRYKDVELQPSCVFATVLDPRFKLIGFSNASNAANALLIKESEEYLLKLSSASPDDQPQLKCSKQDKSSTLCWQRVKGIRKDMTMEIQQKSWLKCI